MRLSCKTGYSFNGWDTKNDGSGTFYYDNALISNPVLDSDDVINLYVQ